MHNEVTTRELNKLKEKDKKTYKRLLERIDGKKKFHNVYIINFANKLIAMGFKLLAEVYVKNTVTEETFTWTMAGIPNVYRECINSCLLAIGHDDADGFEGLFKELSTAPIFNPCDNITIKVDSMLSTIASERRSEPEFKTVMKEWRNHTSTRISMKTGRGKFDNTAREIARKACVVVYGACNDCILDELVMLCENEMHIAIGSPNERQRDMLYKLFMKIYRR